MMWDYNWGFGFFSMIWPFIWILFIVLLFSRLWDRHYHNVDDRNTAEDILSERFAKGEIDEDEYKKRLETLRKHAK